MLSGPEDAETVEHLPERIAYASWDGAASYLDFTLAGLSFNGHQTCVRILKSLSTPSRLTIETDTFVLP